MASEIAGYEEASQRLASSCVALSAVVCGAATRAKGT
jgi:hypothetical protein